MPTPHLFRGAVYSLTAVWAVVLLALILTALGQPTWLMAFALVPVGFVASWTLFGSRSKHGRIEESPRARSLADRLWAALPTVRSAAPPPLTGSMPENTPIDGTIDGVLASLHDLDGRLARQLASLQADALNFAALIEAVDEPVIATVPPDGALLVCNRAAQEFLGVRFDSLGGRRLEDLVTHADLLDLHRAARAGATRRAEVRMARPEGARIFQVTASPLIFITPEPAGPLTDPQTGELSPASERPAPGGAARDDRWGVVMTLRDVTELAGAVQLKTDFVANASHELRTPIAAIRAAADTLADTADDPAMRDRVIRMIANHSARLEELVRDLLDLSRLESPEAPIEIRPVRASELAGAVAPMFDRVIRDRALGLTFDFSPELEHMDTDRQLLQLILKNLIDNSTKFAYEGTDIRVVGRPVPTPPPDAPDRSPARPRPPGRRAVRIEVIDRGIGIPLHQQPRVFERFYQIDAARAGTSERRGTGLGLAIVKHAVRNLGGTIKVASVWKEGTTMTVDLPAALAAAPASDGTAPGGTAPGGTASGGTALQSGEACGQGRSAGSAT